MKRPRLLFAPLLALALLLSGALQAAPPKAAAKKPSAKQGQAGGGHKKAAGKRSASARKTAARPKPAGQQQPAPERIREIQRALAERGYAVEPTGVWDAATVEALKKFQEDHDIRNLTGRGKLDPLTLIALGLGPSQSRAAPSGAAASQSPMEGNRP